MDESCLFHDEWMAEILTFAAARNLRDGLPEEVRWSYEEAEDIKKGLNRPAQEVTNVDKKTFRLDVRGESESSNKG